MLSCNARGHHGYQDCVAKALPGNWRARNKGWPQPQAWPEACVQPFVHMTRIVRAGKKNPMLSIV